MLEARSLPLGHREAFVEVLACLSELSLKRGDQAAFAQGVRQVVLKLAGDFQRFFCYATSLREQCLPTIWSLLCFPA